MSKKIISMLLAVLLMVSGTFPAYGASRKNAPAVVNHNDSLKNNATVENYLHKAGLVKNAPSGIIYQNGNKKLFLSCCYVLCKKM